MTRLSPHFLLSEMLVSSAGSRLGLRNVPSPAQIESLRKLCVNVLEPVRVHYGRPVVVTSGYRSPAVNKAVGGAASSQHCKAEAADFTVPGVSNLAVCEWIAANVPFDQLIYEFGEGGWVHCSYGPRMRGQCLSAKRQRGKTVYLQGLVA